MRADRLVALLLLLQRRPRVTAAQAAEELEVSERTARRDLEALAIAGLPVYSERGRGGGWSLLGGARTDLSGLNAAEARALFLVAGPAAAATPTLRSALRKLVRALPEPFRDGAESSASAVLVDPGRWGESARPSRAPHLDDLQTAIAVGDEVTLGYRDRGGKPSRRVVQPLGVALKGTVWYLVADTDEGLRTFRVNRVTSVVPTGRPLVRPDGFDLARTWREIVERVDDLRSPVTVSAMVDPEVAEVLRWMFDRQIALGEVGPDGRRAATISGPQIDSLAAQLAGFGRRVEIISPAAARDHLGRLGRELVEVYSGWEAATAPRPDPG